MCDLTNRCGQLQKRLRAGTLAGKKSRKVKLESRKWMRKLGSADIDEFCGKGVAHHAGTEHCDFHQMSILRFVFAFLI
jgi:hypothetical protein